MPEIKDGSNHNDGIDYNVEKDDVIKKIFSLWEEMFQIYQELHRLTMLEYQHLSVGNIDQISPTAEEKLLLIDKSKVFEKERKNIIQKINQIYSFQSKNSDSPKKIEHASDIFLFLDETYSRQDSDRFQKINSDLIKIIELTHHQNKKNQIFLNRSLISLKGIKNSLLGLRHYRSYSPRGEEIIGQSY